MDEMKYKPDRTNMADNKVNEHGALPPTTQFTQPFPFRKLPGEIRNQIYRLVLPHQIRQHIQSSDNSVPNSVNASDTDRLIEWSSCKARERERPGWANIPSDSLAILRVDQLMCLEAKACMYSSTTNFEVTVASSGIFFFGRFTSMTCFSPFPSIWQFTRHWTIHLRFHRFHPTQETLWGRDHDKVTGKEHDRRTSSNTYDYIHMMESFISICIELAKIPELETLTITLPCLGYQTGDSYKWINKTYVSVLAHMKAAAVKPGKLIILLAPPLRRQPQCQAKRCLGYALALEEVWRTWKDGFSYNQVTKQWLEMRERAKLQPSTPELRNLLYDIWQLVYFGDLTEEEKLKLMRPSPDGIARWIRRKEQKTIALPCMQDAPIPPSANLHAN
ncbi:MAG: hypothetical protein Q9208_007637 [Pyrenodesmia sp. 3 TL-2023]